MTVSVGGCWASETGNFSWSEGSLELAGVTCTARLKIASMKFTTRSPVMPTGASLSCEGNHKMR